MTKTEIKKILEESVVDPNKPGPTKVMMDAPAHYFSYRATELIEEALRDTDMFQGNVKKAILFLAIARIKNGAKSKPPKPRKKKIVATKIPASELVGS